MRNRKPQRVLGVDVHLDRPREPALAAVRAAIVAVAALCAVALACVAATPAEATPALSWSAAKIDETALTGVSCASSSLCVAVDGKSHALVSASPSGGSSTWHTAEIAGAGAFTGVSCASNTLCVAVDGSGKATISTNPVGGSSTWHTADIAGAGAFAGVSCASNTLCVAVDGSGNAFISTNPGEGGGTGATWRKAEIDTGALTSVSCVAGPLCVAVDKTGDVLVSGEPTGSSWASRQIDSSPLLAISCAPAPAGVCAAVDEAGAALASGNPSAGLPSASTATWSATPLGSLGGAPTGASCTAAGLCVLVANNGDGYVGDDPTAPAPSWTFAGIDPGTPLSAVSCESDGLCAAVSGGLGSGAGQVFVATVPPPVLVTSTPSAVAETTATVTGMVDTNDATLTSCRFEYGSSETYGQSAPCPSTLAAGSANQPVSATLTGLTPNVTYDYRLVAASANGEARTASATFKTTAPPLVQPHPSISGLPAPGQRLTCKSGVSGSGASSATLSYAWLRNTRAISGASGSTYVVGSADVSHHLQCRVSATNAGGSASATSAFVTVPAGGLGAISETQVGTPRVAGRTVSVTITCSAQAAGSCAITLRLTVLETLRGSRVIAVAARRTTRKTVTVGAVTAHVPPGQRGTVTVALNATGRRLLKSFHKLSAKLSVSGTVVGALSAQLRSATVTLGASAGKASSRKTATHRGR